MPAVARSPTRSALEHPAVHHAATARPWRRTVAWPARVTSAPVIIPAALLVRVPLLATLATPERSPPLEDFVPAARSKSRLSARTTPNRCARGALVAARSPITI